LPKTAARDNRLLVSVIPRSSGSTLPFSQGYLEPSLIDRSGRACPPASEVSLLNHSVSGQDAVPAINTGESLIGKPITQMELGNHASLPSVSMRISFGPNVSESKGETRY
jgi:hypothetical protein